MTKRNKTPKFRQAVKDRCGTTCYLCGAMPVEYHHLIPIWTGGEETVENHIALCYKHHTMIHGVVGKKDPERKGGRPKDMPPEGYKDTIDGWLKCKYGTHRCKELLLMEDYNKLADKWWFREYMANSGISLHRNNIDLIVKKNGGKRTPHSYLNDKIVGYIKYADGRIENCYAENVAEW